MEVAGRMVETSGEAKHNVPPVTLNLSEVRLSVWGVSEFDYTSVRTQFAASLCLMSHFFKVPRSTISIYYKYT